MSNRSDPKSGKRETRDSSGRYGDAREALSKIPGPDTVVLAAADQARHFRTFLRNCLSVLRASGDLCGVPMVVEHCGDVKNVRCKVRKV